MKRLISHVRLLFNIRLVHLFSNTFESARYNMIIHVIVFLVIYLFIYLCHRLWKPPQGASLWRRASGHWILDKININSSKLFFHRQNMHNSLWNKPLYFQIFGPWPSSGILQFIKTTSCWQQESDQQWLISNELDRFLAVNNSKWMSPSCFNEL